MKRLKVEWQEDAYDDLRDIYLLVAELSGSETTALRYTNTLAEVPAFVARHRVPA